MGQGQNQQPFGRRFLKAHGHLNLSCVVVTKDFLLLQQRRLIWVRERDLLGCEMAAEIGHLDSVYGIVTNHVQWNFWRRLNEKIELE